MTPLGFRKPEAVAAVSDTLPSLFAAPGGASANRATNFLWSALLHTLAVAALLFVARITPELKWNGMPPPLRDLQDAVFTVPCEQVSSCGGGGNRDKLRASLGVLPRITRMQITPPTTHIMNLVPKLTVEETIVAPNVELPRQQGPLGDPFHGVQGPSSDGPGKRGGIGQGCCGGIGPDQGPGAGHGNPAYLRITGGVKPPKAVYAPDPEYSEEARKIKQQGTVVLWVVVGADGRVRDVRVQRSLGFGLDEKALEAVRMWKFEPARVDHQPVAVQINVEVRFRLY